MNIKLQSVLNDYNGGVGEECEYGIYEATPNSAKARKALAAVRGPEARSPSNEGVSAWGTQGLYDQV